MDNRVIGIFDSEKHVDRALNDLYEHGFDSRQITLMDQNRSITGPLVDDMAEGGNASGTSHPVNTGSVTTGPLVTPGSATPPVNEPGANTLNPVGAIPLGAVLAAGYEDLGSGGAVEFYKRALTNGSSLIIVRTSPERANEARLILKRAHATNVSGDTSAAAQV